MRKILNDRAVELIREYLESYYDSRKDDRLTYADRLVGMLDAVLDMAEDVTDENHSA